MEGQGYKITVASYYAKAQVLLEEAKAILESRLPPNHPEVGRILARLGEVHLRQGNLEQSETLYQGALTILEHAWGQESPRLLPLLENYSVVLRSRKDYAAAASVDMRTMRIRVKLPSRVSPEVRDSIPCPALRRCLPETKCICSLELNGFQSRPIQPFDQMRRL